MFKRIFRTETVFVLITFFYSMAYAQLEESFSDGDFTNSPTWSGDISEFIINGAQELQLNATIAGDSYLVTPHLLSILDSTEWRFKIGLNFSPSASNQAVVYLAAADPDLTTNPDGIYVQFGESGSGDLIRIFNRVSGIDTQILQGTNAQIASAFEISVKIKYATDGTWSLFVDPNGGNAFMLDTSTVFLTNNLQPYYGWICTYTVSNIDNFLLDNIYVGPILVDSAPPVLINANPVSSNTLIIEFDEAVTQSSAENTSNYVLNSPLGSPTTAVRDPNNWSSVTLTFASPFEIGFLYSLTANSIADLATNINTSQNIDFQYIESQIPIFGDVIINEFMPKESPAIGLPERQYVEIYNRSNKYFELSNWTLSDRTTTGTIQPGWLYPGQYALLVPTSALVDYPNAINVTNWGTLNNTGDDIMLQFTNGQIIDELSYTDEWYHDPSATGGGISIERINPNLPCSDENNWKASIQPSGGTPGNMNSVINMTPDSSNPVIVDVLAIYPDSLRISFSEGMDTVSLQLMDITFTPQLIIQERIITGPFPNEFVIKFNNPIIPGQVYQFDAINFEDCSGNPNDYSGSFVLPNVPSGDELVINEILHNPYTGGADFIELFNNSDNYIDLIGWELANFDDDTVSNHKIIDFHYILYPLDYVVITKDSLFQQQTYPFSSTGNFIQLSSLPNYNNDSSTVFLIYDNTIVDQVSYNEKWHFSLLESYKGVSLERFNFDEPSNDPNNWHSASETVEFATPGTKNSQIYSVNVDGEITLSSNSISPDNDGFEDVILVNYQLSTPELVGSLIVYDDKGRVIKTLMNAELLGNAGSIQWDGTRDDYSKASIGIYIIAFEALNTSNGSLFQVKKAVTVAGKI